MLDEDEETPRERQTFAPKPEPIALKFVLGVKHDTGLEDFAAFWYRIEEHGC